VLALVVEHVLLLTVQIFEREVIDRQLGVRGRQLDAAGARRAAGLSEPMDILYLLIPLSSVLVLGIVGVFAWALTRGQFEELDREGERILDEAQGRQDPVREESRVP